MSRVFPEGKTTLKIKTRGLPGLKGSSGTEFEFGIRIVKDGFKMWIPGSPRGFDLVIPHSKEQDGWLQKTDKRFGEEFQEIWYCLWHFNTQKALEKFLEIIDRQTIEKEYE